MFDTIGYTYQADTYCHIHGVTEPLRIAAGNGAISEAAAGRLASASLDFAYADLSDSNREILADAILRDLAAELIAADSLAPFDYLDSRTFDSDDFPKAFADNSESDTCATCGRVIGADPDEPTPAEIERRVTAVTDALESISREVCDLITSAEILTDVWHAPLTPERIGVEVSELIGRAIDAARAGGDADDYYGEPLPLNYAGTVLTVATVSGGAR